MALRSLNNPLASFIDYLAKTGTDASTPVPGPISATGGVISDYVSGPTIYRSHIFTSSGTFTVTDGAGSVEYLVVGGGGGGYFGPGGTQGKGGGSGGPYAGAGDGGVNNPPIGGGSGQSNSGSGGGAGAWIVPPPNSFGGSGGSGIVLIAYPS